MASPVSLPHVENGRTIRNVQLDDAEYLYKVINWAYRGKDLQGGKVWTGEGHLIQGDRITLPDLKNMITSTERGKAYHLLVLEDEKLGLVGCMKIELHGGNEAEFGLFAIDPSYQSQGFGGYLFRFAMKYAKEVLNCTKGSMCVITIRPEILAWYNKLGFKDTGKRVPFPTSSTDDNCGRPRPEIIEKYGGLEFAVLETPL